MSEPINDNPSAAERSVWALLDGKLDFSKSRPQVKPGFEEARFSDSAGQGYYVLKAPQHAGYVKLGENDRYLFSLFDGSRTVQQVLVDYFRKYGALAFARVGSLVGQLKNGGFLTEQPVDLYRKLLERLKLQKPLARLIDFWLKLPQRQWPVPGFDGLVGALYRRGFWLFFTPAVIAVTALVSLAGLASFVPALRDARYSVLTSRSGSYVWGIVILILLNYVAVITHEASHALACKRFKRQVNSGGTILKWGFPAFYVDTTDTWLLPRRQRMLVTVVGPYTQFFLAGTASLFLWWQPSFRLDPYLYKFAFLSYLSVFLNFNPLLQLDGYYVLVDWLDIPSLREKAMRFVQHDLLGRLRARQPLDRTEKIYAAFGLSVIVWSAAALALGFYFYHLQAVAMAGAFLRHTTRTMRIALLAALALLLAGSAATARRRIARAWAALWQQLLGVVGRHTTAAGTALTALTLALAWLVALTGGWFYEGLTVLLLLGGIALFFRVNKYYQGSHLSLTLVSLLAAAVTGIVTPKLADPLWIVLLLAGSSAAFLAGYSQFSFTSLRRWRTWQRWLWGGLWYGSLLVIGLTAHLRTYQTLALLLAVATFLMVLSLIWNNRGSSLQYFWIMFLLGTVAWALYPVHIAAAWLSVAAATLELGAIGWLYLVIRSTSWSPEVSAYEPAASERRRMRQAAVKIYKMSRTYFTAFFGVAAARAMDDRLNLIMIERGWPIRLYGTSSEERFERTVGIVERAGAFRGMLDAMHAYLAAEAG
ncbi:MAG TPA: M50 family metallopeptidase, partial [Candidatus Edwardsbacteria bacterium]|nr:M50 family metallopeptidase [Candidatus Edwardsbacteria bacterium]